MVSDISRVLATKIGLRLVELTTRPDNIPFYRGDLRKSISFELSGSGQDTIVTVGSNLVYAKSVHDGRKELTIYPKRGKILAWWVDPSKKKRMVPLPRGKAFREAVKDKEIIIARSVTQPSTKPNPFLHRAILALDKEGLEFLERDLQKYAESYLEKSLK